VRAYYFDRFPTAPPPDLAGPRVLARATHLVRYSNFNVNRPLSRVDTATIAGWLK